MYEMHRTYFVIYVIYTHIYTFRFLFSLLSTHFFFHWYQQCVTGHDVPKCISRNASFDKKSF